MQLLNKRNKPQEVSWITEASLYKYFWSSAAKWVWFQETVKCHNLKHFCVDVI